MIPKNIFQIYHDKKIIKNTIINNLKELNPEYQYYLYDFTDGANFIKQHFNDDLADKIILYINNLERYAHKSDLLRYCLLYIYGGVYIDVDLKQKLDLNRIIELSDNADMITSYGLGGDITKMSSQEIKNNNEKLHPIISNGMLFSIPKNKIIYDQIMHIIYGPYKLRHSKFIHYFYDYLFKSNDNNIEPFKKINIENINIYLFREITFDINGKCCFIDKGNNIIMYSNNCMNKDEYLLTPCIN